MNNYRDSYHMKALAWIVGLLALVTFGPATVASAQTSNATMQQLRGDETLVTSPLLSGQFGLTHVHGGTAGSIDKVKIGQASGLGDLTIWNAAWTYDNALNSIYGNVTLLGGNGITITVASPNITVSLTATGVAAGTYGDGTHVFGGIVSSTGQLTSASSIAIAFPVTSVSESGGTTGLTFSGSSTGAVTWTLGGTLGTANGGTGNTLGAEPPLGNPSSNGQVLASTTSGTRSWITPPSAGGSGTVTSIAFSAPSGTFSISGSPVTTSGTIALSLAAQSPNVGFLGPPSGSSAGIPTWRAMVAADIPALAYEHPLGNPSVNGQVLASTTAGVRSWYTLPAGNSGTVTSVSQTVPSSTFAISGSPITSSGTLSLSLVTQSANVGFFGPASGGAAIPTWRAMVAADVPALNYEPPLGNPSANGQVLASTTSGIRSWYTLPTASSGTVTSVAASGGSTGLTFSGSPITTSGTFSLGGTLGIASGGTGQTTASAALTALLPAQSSGTNAQVLTSNGTSAAWATPSGGGTGSGPTLPRCTVVLLQGKTPSGTGGDTYEYVLPFGQSGATLTYTIIAQHLRLGTAATAGSTFVYVNYYGSGTSAFTTDGSFGGATVTAGNYESNGGGATPIATMGVSMQSGGKIRCYVSNLGTGAANITYEIEFTCS